MNSCQPKACQPEACQPEEEHCDFCAMSGFFVILLAIVGVGVGFALQFPQKWIFAAYAIGFMIVSGLLLVVMILSSPEEIFH